MNKHLLTNLFVLGIFVISLNACNCNNSSENCDENTNCKTKSEMKYSKKYTNADFYKDGKFDEAVAMEAMKDMFEFYDVPFTPFMEKEVWVTDFGLGDFENVGMGGECSG